MSINSTLREATSNSGVMAVTGHFANTADE